MVSFKEGNRCCAAELTRWSGDADSGQALGIGGHGRWFGDADRLRSIDGGVG